MSCHRAQGFLAREHRAVARTTDAKKERLGAKDALALAEAADEIYVAKRGTIVHFDRRTAKPTRDELLAAILGPTGNLRAPVVKLGRTLIVGFDEATYRKLVR